MGAIVSSPKDTQRVPSLRARLRAFCFDLAKNHGRVMLYLIRFMWRNRLSRFLIVALHTFVSWAVLVFIFSFVVIYPNWLMVVLRVAVFVIIFAIVFHHYYQSYKQTLPFFATVHTLASFVFFDAMRWIFFPATLKSDLNFVDWILPFFAIATTVYFIGGRRREDV